MIPRLVHSVIEILTMKNASFYFPSSMVSSTSSGSSSNSAVYFPTYVVSFSGFFFFGFAICLILGSSITGNFIPRSSLDYGLVSSNKFLADLEIGAKVTRDTFSVHHRLFRLRRFNSPC